MHRHLYIFTYIHSFLYPGIGAKTQQTEKVLKKGILGIKKNFTDLADLAIAEYDEADLSPQVCMYMLIYMCV
jgi:hypothetical protein